MKFSIVMALFGGTFLNVGFSPLLIDAAAQQVKMQSEEYPNHEQDRVDFWRKFRETVEDRKKPPGKDYTPLPAKQSSKPK